MRNVCLRRRDNRRHSYRRIPIVGIPSLFFKWTVERALLVCTSFLDLQHRLTSCV